MVNRFWPQHLKHFIDIKQDFFLFLDYLTINIKGNSEERGCLRYSPEETGKRRNGSVKKGDNPHQNSHFNMKHLH